MRGITAISLYMLGYVLVLLAGLHVWASLMADHAPSAGTVTVLLGLAIVSAVAGETVLRRGRARVHA